MAKVNIAFPQIQTKNDPRTYATNECFSKRGYCCYCIHIANLNGYHLVLELQITEEICYFSRFVMDETVLVLAFIYAYLLHQLINRNFVPESAVNHRSLILSCVVLIHLRNS